MMLIFSHGQLGWLGNMSPAEEYYYAGTYHGILGLGELVLGVLVPRYLLGFWFPGTSWGFGSQVPLGVLVPRYFLGFWFPGGQMS